MASDTLDSTSQDVNQLKKERESEGENEIKCKDCGEAVIFCMRNNFLPADPICEILRTVNGWAE